MTEQEWLTCTDPTPMLEFLRGKASERKLRLLVVGCVCQAWSDCKTSETQEAWKAIEVAERYSDELASDKQLQAAHQSVLAAPEWDDLAIHFLYAYASSATAAKIDKAFAVATKSDYAARTTPHASPIIDADRIQRCRLIREIVANPFRPVIASCCLTATVIAIAQTIYDNRAFDRMPELANALYDAGCDNDEILSHCRGPEPHVRGCWALDMMLGKE
jgi:hypothetical protein